MQAVSLQQDAEDAARVAVWAAVDVLHERAKVGLRYHAMSTPMALLARLASYPDDWVVRAAYSDYLFELNDPTYEYWAWTHHAMRRPGQDLDDMWYFGHYKEVPKSLIREGEVFYSLQAAEATYAERFAALPEKDKGELWLLVPQSFDMPKASHTWIAQSHRLGTRRGF